MTASSEPQSTSGGQRSVAGLAGALTNGAWLGLGLGLGRGLVLFGMWRYAHNLEPRATHAELAELLPGTMAIALAIGLACAWLARSSARRTPARRVVAVATCLVCAIGMTVFLAGLGSEDTSRRVGTYSGRGAWTLSALGAGALVAAGLLVASARRQRSAQSGSGWRSALPFLLALVVMVGAPIARQSSTLRSFGERMLARSADAIPHEPSIILISIDALRRDHLGLYGYSRDTSPALDNFAKECVVFDRAYAVAPWTLISHLTMFSGLFPSQHGVVDDGMQLSPEIPTLAERLQDRGYFTAGLYYPGWIHERFGYGRGFDVFKPYKVGRKNKLKEHYAGVLEELPHDRPFFLFLHVWDVHSARLGGWKPTIYEPPPPFDSMFIPDAKERLDGIDAAAVFKSGAPTTPAQHEAIVALYDGGVRYVDTFLGEWIDEWRRSGVLDQSVVIVTSDHGEALGQREGQGGHGSSFEEGLRVPLLVRYPDGRGAGSRRREVVSHVDIVPTVLDLLRVRPQPWLPGYALHGDLPTERVLFVERPPLRAILDFPYKFSWDERSGPEKGWIFNVVTDADELAPITRETHPKLFDLRRAAIESRAEEQLASWPPLPAHTIPGETATDEELRALEELGYLGDG